MRTLAAVGISSTVLLAAAGCSGSSTTRSVAVTFTGGHDTGPRDGGRPVALVAGALGVPAAVFRTAFSGVTPAAAGALPETSQVGLNKQALLRVLGPYGVTNDRLDEVSNYYRYVGSAGETWPTTPAKAIATVRGGKVVSVRVTDGGSGYTTTPTATVAGTAVSVSLTFSATFAHNGSVASVAAG